MQQKLLIFFCVQDYPLYFMTNLEASTTINLILNEEGFYWGILSLVSSLRSVLKL